MLPIVADRWLIEQWEGRGMKSGLQKGKKETKVLKIGLNGGRDCKRNTNSRIQRFDKRHAL